jgi:hypothetical protein
MSYTYRDSRGNILDSSDVVSETEKGVVEDIGNTSFRYRTDVKKEKDATEYNKLMSSPEVPSKATTTPFSSTTPATQDTDLGVFYEYIFGIDSLELYSSLSAPSGFTSTTINIGNVDFIELSAEEEGDCLNEYYIIDGLEEKPILPKQATRIKEKVFPGLPLRFEPQTSELASLTKNGRPDSRSLQDLDKLTNDGEYILEYTPQENSHYVHPKSNEIKLKVIQRKSGAIKSLVILKHGGEKLWHI